MGCEPRPARRRIQEIGLGNIRCNPDTKKVYAWSLDGTHVQLLIADLRKHFEDDDRPTTADWGLMNSKSELLKATAATGRRRAITTK